MGIVIETVKTESFSMNCFRFGQGKETFVILPGLSVQSVMGFAQSVAEAYQLLADMYLTVAMNYLDPTASLIWQMIRQKCSKH